MQNSILFHRQEPLFHNAFTLFEIVNETSLTVKSQTYTFELIPYEPPTSKTGLTPILVIFGLISYTIIRKRRKKKL